MILHGENKLKAFILKKRYLLFLTTITLLSVLLRYTLRKFISADYVGFLHPWFVVSKHLGGIFSLKRQIGDYNILYQFIISLFSYLPFRDLYLYKLLSSFFDFVLAISAGWLAVIINKNPLSNKKIFALTYATILILPTVLLNSAVWAQCDSIYTSFIVLSLAFLFKKRNILSFLMLGLAFAFKFQAIFVLPFFLYVWMTKKNIYIWHFLIATFVFWLSGIPGYIFGRSLLSPFEIYLNQTHTYNYLFMNYYNFSGLFGLQINKVGAFHFFEKAFILATIIILMIGFMYLLSNYQLSDILYLGVTIWTVYTCVMFLPAIHERYAFVVDILIVVLAILNKKYILIAVPEILISFMSYGRVLFFDKSNIVALSLIALIVYVSFTIILLHDYKVYCESEKA